MKLHTILVPVMLPDVPRGLLRQAAWLARRFHAEIVLLHVLAPLDYPYGLLESGHGLTPRDLEADVVRIAQDCLDRTPLPEFDGIAVTRVMVRGDPARQIVAVATDRQASLIAMNTHGFGALHRFLLGSVTAKVLHETQSPVWTGAHLEDAQAHEFSIRRVLCSVDLSSHNRHTLSLAAAMAAAADAELTLVHVTASVDRWGPGGSQVDPAWQQTLVGGALEEIAKLQHDVGTAVEVIIESGNVPRMLNRAAQRTGADVLVIGHIAGHSHLADNGEGYGIIRESCIPVLSV